MNEAKDKADRILQLATLPEINAAYEIEPGTDSETLMLALLHSGDVLHSQKAANWLAKYRVTKHLEKIKQIRASLPEKPGLRDYRRTVDRTIAILENFAAGAACHCNLYDTRGQFDERFTPAWEEREDFIAIEKETVHAEEYFSDWLVVCNVCRRKWFVKDDTSYHFPLYAWEER